MPAAEAWLCLMLLELSPTQLDASDGMDFNRLAF